MKFKGEPNLYVRLSNKYVQRVTGKKGFMFDDKGEFSTDNELLINILSQNFETVQVENNAPGEEIKLKHCKKCGFTCETQGELLQHYKKIHPKEGK